MDAIKNADDGRGQLIDMSAAIHQLRPKRREIIRPVLENPRDFVLLSARELAGRLKTDPATIVRIVRQMGFRNYRLFREYLQELTIANATSLESMQTGSAKGSNIPAHVRESLNTDCKNLSSLRTSLDVKRLAGLAKRIYAAKRILILGGDLAISLVWFLEYHLTVLGLPAFSATTTGRVVSLVRTVGKNDLTIAISYRRGLRQTVEGLQQAHSNGAYCVGITDTFVSPITRFADECFITSVATPSFGMSYVAPMALMNGIMVACANYRRARTLALIQQAAEEQQHGFRWFED
jgi:DNA-binding MurR/RpiR family transcriptional regulator